MYKWPQGRVIRTICLVMVLIIAGDLGWDAFNRFDVYFNPTGEAASWRVLLAASISMLATLVVLIGGLISIGFKHAHVDFLIEVEQEMVRVTWPSGRQLVQSTIWIAIMIVILTVGIFAVDSINFKVLNFIFNR
jgi:preprotein translocase SecE subunit